MKTFIPTEKDMARKTYLIDADGKTLGRMATKVASLLMGKGKTCFMPDKITGDQVVVINAAKVHVTGKKQENKIYTHYTGYSSGLKTSTYEQLMAKKPTEIIMRAVSRMLPKNRIGDVMLKRLRVYAGSEYRNKAQKPTKIEV
ncbi:MAG TPA: 50S ribosomal protein L13 [Candidatus Omnitrophota bacterium]|nr:50S ribosomal protein L13 [Candidatus Omnitrophota bacterium]HRY85065.1 50S ribosomal protein L13 [Candidatus Omnitrophota bacterium]